MGSEDSPKTPPWKRKHSDRGLRATPVARGSVAKQISTAVTKENTCDDIASRVYYSASKTCATPPPVLYPVASIHYTHDSISSLFRDGRPITDTIHQLFNGSVKALEEPWLVLDGVEEGGKIYCNNNRRLYCLKQFQERVSFEVVVQMRLTHMADQDVRIRDFIRGYTSDTLGKEVVVRKAKANALTVRRRELPVVPDVPGTREEEQAVAPQSEKAIAGHGSDISHRPTESSRSRLAGRKTRYVDAGALSDTNEAACAISADESSRSRLAGRRSLHVGALSKVRESAPWHKRKRHGHACPTGRLAWQKIKGDDDCCPTGRLYVGNMPKDMTSQDLLRNFLPYGEILGCHLLQTRNSGKQAAIIRFSNPEDAAAALFCLKDDLEVRLAKPNLQWDTK